MDKINFQNGITPLNQTNLNQMQDNIENAINTAQNYSTEEQVIGTWEKADGTKVPLYRKVLYGSSTGVDLFLATPPEIETMVRYEIYAGNNNALSRKIPSTEISNNNGNTIFDVIWLKDDWVKNCFYIVSSNENGREVAIGDVTAIIEYAKTTDV